MKLSVRKTLPSELKLAKVVPFSKIAKGSPIKLGRGSNAAIIIDNEKTPQIFLFDTSAFLDVLSTIDEALVDRLSTEEYHDKTINSAGWLIDKIEAKLPLNPNFIVSLKKSISGAMKKGFIPFEKIQQELGLI